MSPPSGCLWPVMLAVCSGLHLMPEPTSLAAQTPTVLDTGARIRIRPTGEGNLVGTLLFIDRDSLVVGVEYANRPVPLADLQWIDVSQGKRRNFTRGLFIGAIVGSVSLLIYNAAVRSGCTVACPEKTKSAAGFGVAGALGGAAVGYFIRTDRWQRLHLPPLREAKRNPPRRADFHGS